MDRLRLGEKRRCELGDLHTLAGEIWDALPSGSVVWLTGELGAGKTTFVQSIAKVADAEPARSPTFALVHEYECPIGLIFHVDCYRLRSPDEALDLDFPAILKRARMLLIEWPERAGDLAPTPDLELTFSHVGDPGSRQVERVR